MLSRLLDQYTAPLVLYARQLCADPEDAVQAAFVKLAQADRFPEDCAAWLYRVVRNEALQQRRGDQRRRERETAFAEVRSAWFEADPSSRLDAQAAADALGRLSPVQREVVVARIWGGLAFREIAQLVGVSVSAAHREYHQAIEALQHELNEPCRNHPTPPT